MKKKLILLLCLSTLALHMYGAQDYKKLSSGSMNKNVSKVGALSAQIRKARIYLSCANNESQEKKQNQVRVALKGSPSVQSMNIQSSRCERCCDQLTCVGKEDACCKSVTGLCIAGCFAYPCYMFCCSVYELCGGCGGWPCCDGRCG